MWGGLAVGSGGNVGGAALVRPGGCVRDWAAECDGWPLDAETIGVEREDPGLRPSRAKIVGDIVSAVSGQRLMWGRLNGGL